MHEVGCKNGICGHACNQHVLPFDVNLNYRFKNIFFSYLGIIYFLSGLVKECSGQPFYFLFFPNIILLCLLVDMFGITK